MDDFARRNLRDFLSMYNQFTEVCFNNCIRNFNYRQMIPEEEACANRCAEKLINVNHRLIAVYMEINPLHKQAATLEAAQTAGAAAQSSSSATPDQTTPLNLAGQVQAVFGPDTVVTDGVSSAVPALDIPNTATRQESSHLLQGDSVDQGTHLQDSNITMGMNEGTNDAVRS